jgi:hypothetical protein
MYTHNILRVNYTTYDVRRDQDTMNPKTSHRDIMVLASDNDSEDNHHFLYARVLGVFHVNVVYTGRGTADYRPRRFDFLWVRWFKLESDTGCGWVSSSLDRLCFPPMSQEDAFGFLDPADVLRGCHIIPSFSLGQRHLNEPGLSLCAKDAFDWRSYYLNRWVSIPSLVVITLINISSGSWIVI